MNPLKVSRLLLLLLFFLVSCFSSNQLRQYNNFIRLFQSYYSNDSLGVCYTMGGDYEQVTSWKQVFKSVKKYGKIKSTKKSFISGFKTFTTPDLAHYLFYSKTYNFASKDTNIHIDTNKYFLKKAFKLPEDRGTLLLVAHALNKESFFNLKSEYKGIINTFSFEKNCKIISDEDYFSDANRFFFSNRKDSTPNYLLPAYQLYKINNTHKSNANQFILIQAALTYNSFVSGSFEFSKLLDQHFAITHTPQWSLKSIVKVYIL